MVRRAWLCALLLACFIAWPYPCEAAGGRCPQCGKVYEAGKFCPFHGKALQPIPKFCANCGQRVGRTQGLRNSRGRVLVSSRTTPVTTPVEGDLYRVVGRPPR